LLKFKDSNVSNTSNQTIGDAQVSNSQQSNRMSTRQLAFIGIGGIIGAGFFLGSGLPIRTAGPAVLLAFIIGAVVTAQVTGALTSMAVNHPVRGSFKVYADTYIGAFAGYLQGWVYYVTSILTIASEAVAMAIFTKLWIPNVPTWLTAGIFAAFIIALNAFGVKNFGRVESIMSAVKITALVAFIIFGLIMVIPTFGSSLQLLSMHGGFMPHGFSGVLQSMLIVIFAYAGIGVFATAAAQTQQKKVIDHGATWTVVGLAILYLLAIGLLLILQPWNEISTLKSPFVVVLTHSGIPFIGTIFNAVILIASFSVMAGAVFSANQILFSLGSSSEAPRFVNRSTDSGIDYGSLIVTSAGIAVAITASYLLPANVYNFLISASSFFTFLNWSIILLSFLLWKRKYRGENLFTSRLAFGQPVMTVVTMLTILVLAGYALLQHDQRVGFYAAVCVTAVVSFSYLFVRNKKRRIVHG